MFSVSGYFNLEQAVYVYYCCIKIYEGVWCIKMNYTEYFLIIFSFVMVKGA